jgi:hypothetical protein
LFNVGNQFRKSLSTHISNFDDIGKCWICAVLWWPFWNWRPVEMFQCRESIRDIIIYPHIKFWWYRKMLNICSIVAAILKMTTGRNLSMSGINSGHHYLPTYQILLISDNVEFLRYCGGHFENGDRRNCSMSGINSGHHYLPTYQILMISDNVEFLPPIFYTVFWQPFWKWQISRNFENTELLL